MTTTRHDDQLSSYWAAYQCFSCGCVITAQSYPTGRGSNVRTLWQTYPSGKTAHEDIPDVARRYLQQAIDTLHAPDASAVMAGSAVDAMLKHLGYQDGALYSRIDLATKDGLLTSAMSDWAHEVRLGSNRPRHADSDNPHVSSDEAAQSVEFAEALGSFLFVLTARIGRGIEAAKLASS